MYGVVAEQQWNVFNLRYILPKRKKKKRNSLQRIPIWCIGVQSYTFIVTVLQDDLFQVSDWKVSLTYFFLDHAKILFKIECVTNIYRNLKKANWQVFPNILSRKPGVSYGKPLIEKIHAKCDVPARKSIDMMQKRKIHVSACPANGGHH